jgi:hypothetical protein
MAYFVVNGADVSVAPGRPYGVRSGDDGSQWPTFEQTINDAPSNMTIQIVDKFNQLGLTTGMEVIVWDETTPGTNAPNGFGGFTPIPTIPAMNYAVNATLLNDGFGHAPANWSESGTLPSTVFSYPQEEIVLTVANNIVGYALQSQTTPLYSVKAGQDYMLSCYMTGSGTINNLHSLLELTFFDIDGNNLGTIIDERVPLIGQKRIAISGIAPAGAVQAGIAFGGITLSSTNSGAIAFGSVQFEPMWFTTQGVSYPTPDCNATQVNSAEMPDGTFSRVCRVFSGYIDDLQWYWEGTQRVWTLSVASAGSLLDNGPQINMDVSNIYDDQVISTVIGTYFSGLLSINAANQRSANPIVRGILVPSDSYSDKTFRDLLNGLSAQSGYNSYVDPYYRLHYNPQFYAAAPFGLSDQPDNLTTFEMHDFAGEEDATTRKRNIKILGGPYLTPYEDSYTATGGQTIFNLTWQPKSPTGKVVLNGSGVTTGVYGVHDPSHYVVLVDKANQKLIFTTGRTGGDTVAYSYSYEAPVSCQVIDQDTSNPITSPSYAQPPFYSQVHDTSITNLAGGTLRGLAELTAWSKPKKLFTLSAFNYIQPGLIVFLTSHLDGIINQPYLVTKCDGSFLGNGVNEYQYTVGAYLPTITDYVRYAYKAHQLSSTTANVTVPQNINIVFSEFMAYSELPVVYTQVPGPPYRYGECLYGFCTPS